MLWLSVSWGQDYSGTYLPPTDSLKTTKSDSSKQKSFLSEVFFDTRTTATTIVAWPFENVIEPTLGMMIYPVAPPIQYVFKENMIDRGLSFSSVGEDKNILIYPTMSLGAGIESSLGLGYIHNSLLFHNEDRAKLEIFRTIDDDWFQRASYFKRRFLGSSVTYNAEIVKNNFKNTDLYTPANKIDSTWLRSDYSTTLKFKVNFPILNNTRGFIVSQIAIKDYETKDQYQAKLLTRTESLPEELRKRVNLHNRVYSDLYARGFWGRYTAYPLGIGFVEDSKENVFASTSGHRLRGRFEHVYVNHGLGDYQNLRLSLEYYKLLGNKSYTLSKEENRKNQRYLRNFRIDDALALFKPEDWRRVYLQQKVLVTYLDFRQAWDYEHNNPAIYDALSQLGGNSPLRGYPARRFVDYGRFIWSTEYRWPLIQYIDGVFFNEYGWSFRGPHTLNLLDFKNSWGFGLRARKPNFFILRFSVGLHGPIFDRQPIKGIVARVTIRPEF